ncbi:MAG: sensor histidine kinase [Bacteroidia bacterium]
MIKHKSLPFILSILSICVVGLVLVQAYWIYKDYGFYRSQPLLSTGFDFYMQQPSIGATRGAVQNDTSHRILTLEPLQNGVSNPQQRQRVTKSIPATAIPGVASTVELTKLSPVDVPVDYYRNKVFWQLGYSFFLILITAGSLFYMLIVIFKQRKNSSFKSEFIDNMAHELLTPVSNIGLAIHSMKNYGVLEDEQKKEVYLDICKYEVDHLGGLVDQILEQSLFDTGKMELNKHPVDVNVLVRNVIKRYLVADSNAIINFEHASEAQSVEIDATHMINVLKNLIDNALRYSLQSKEIYIKNTFEDGYWVLSVRDNGIGIDKKYLKAIFDKFFRVKGTPVKVKGFGLGLSYVKQVAELHHGKVKVDSDSNGSTFYIYIPTTA